MFNLVTTENWTGNPVELADEFPWVSSENAAGYLVQQKDGGDPNPLLKTPPEPGAPYPRSHEVAALNFYHLLRIPYEEAESEVRFPAPIAHSFRIVPYSRNSSPTKIRQR